MQQQLPEREHVVGDEGGGPDVEGQVLPLGRQQRLEVAGADEREPSQRRAVEGAGVAVGRRQGRRGGVDGRGDGGGRGRRGRVLSAAEARRRLRRRALPLELAAELPDLRANAVRTFGASDPVLRGQRAEVEHGPIEAFVGVGAVADRRRELRGDLFEELGRGVLGGRRRVPVRGRGSGAAGGGGRSGELG